MSKSPLKRKFNWKDWFFKTEYHSSNLNDINALIVANQIEEFESIVDSKINLNKADDLGRIPLHFAAEKNRKDFIESLIKYGAGLDFLDEHGESALFKAARSNANETARKLIWLGIDVLHENNFGQTSLDVAISLGNVLFSELYISCLNEMNIIIGNLRSAEAAKFSKSGNQKIKYDSMVNARLPATDQKFYYDPEKGLPAIELKAKRLEKYLQLKGIPIPSKE